MRSSDILRAQVADASNYLEQTSGLYRLVAAGSGGAFLLIAGMVPTIVEKSLLNADVSRLALFVTIVALGVATLAFGYAAFCVGDRQRGLSRAMSRSDVFDLVDSEEARRNPSSVAQAKELMRMVLDRQAFTRIGPAAVAVGSIAFPIAVVAFCIFMWAIIGIKFG